MSEVAKTTGDFTVTKSEKPDGWKVESGERDTVDQKTGAKVHEEKMHGTREDEAHHTKETIDAKLKRVEGDNFKSEAVCETYVKTSA